MIFYFFPPKQDHANFPLGENLDKMSIPIFWEKQEKYFKMSFAEIFA